MIICLLFFDFPYWFHDNFAAFFWALLDIACSIRDPHQLYLILIVLSNIAFFFYYHLRNIVKSTTCWLWEMQWWLTLKKLFFVVSIHPVLHTSELVFQMIFQLSGPIKLAPAIFTAKFSIFVVSPDMILQMPFGDKVLGAHLTLIVPMSIVRLQVNIKVTFFCEFVPTKVAAVGFDS